MKFAALLLFATATSAQNCNFTTEVTDKACVVDGTCCAYVKSMDMTPTEKYKALDAAGKEAAVEKMRVMMDEKFKSGKSNCQK